LIVAAAGRLNPLLELSDHVVVETNRDTYLSRRRHDRYVP
jgi:hypothetical protein